MCGVGVRVQALLALRRRLQDGPDEMARKGPNIVCQWRGRGPVRLCVGDKRAAFVGGKLAGNAVDEGATDDGDGCEQRGVHCRVGGAFGLCSGGNCRGSRGVGVSFADLAVLGSHLCDKHGGSAHAVENVSGRHDGKMGAVGEMRDGVKRYEKARLWCSPHSCPFLNKIDRRERGVKS